MTIPLDFQIKRLGVPVTKENWERTTVHPGKGFLMVRFYQRGEEKKKEITETRKCW